MRSVVITALLLLPAAGQDPGKSSNPGASRPDWQRLELPSAAGSVTPEVTSTATGALLTWIEPVGKGSHALQLRQYDDGRFAAPSRVVEGGTLFVNWADFASAVVAGDGAVVAHWLRRGGRGQYGIEVARRPPGADPFTGLGHPHREGIRGEAGFVSMLPEGAGVRLFWLDGRNYERQRRMELRTTTIVGDTFGAEEVLDPDVCTCCQTSAIVTANGPAIVYRGHTAGEVRDILIARRDGDGWTKPRAVADDGWVVPGCPVNGPAMAARGSQVAVVWYTGAKDGAGVKLALSDDAGATFARAHQVDREDPVGRCDIAATAHGFVLCWLAAGDDGSVLRTQEWVNDAPGPAVDVARVPASRESGFPRLTAVRGGALLVWTGSDGIHAAHWLQ